VRRSNCPESGDCATARRYPGLEDAARLFRALADETRLAILKLLGEQDEVCACDFAACCDLAQPTVSHHLKVLREAGLIQGEKRGLWVQYRLNADKATRLRAILP
jgi:ArsR family transcriptional regulator, arsenate/arsenite/antimonite-responsive transcriptional repressor